MNLNPISHGVIIPIVHASTICVSDKNNHFQLTIEGDELNERGILKSTKVKIQFCLIFNNKLNENRLLVYIFGLYRGS